jgi:high affinity choline transporter 7
VLRNLYQKVLRPNAYEREVVLALRAFILLTCLLATGLAVRCSSIYALFVLCGDFMYVMVFPQLVLVLFWPRANTYGCVSSFVTSLLLRLLAGEPALGLPALLSFGEVAAACPAGFCTGRPPFRTIVMLTGALVHLLVTQVTDTLFTKGLLGLRTDFLNCYTMDQTGKVSAAFLDWTCIVRGRWSSGPPLR